MNTQILLLPEEQGSAKPGAKADDFAGPWNSCCEWIGRTVKGIRASMERVERNGTTRLEFQDWPLVAIRARRLENGVNAISLTFATNNHERQFEITGVNAVQLERDAAGFPTAVQFVSESEKVILRFTNGHQATPTYSSNSWGE